MLIHRLEIRLEWIHGCGGLKEAASRFPARADRDAFEDRTLEITGYLPIAVEDLLVRLDVLGEAI